MIKDIAEKLSRELRISLDKVVREEWEMKVLEKISQSVIGDKIMFKGGTALRLAYNSPRFSDDLDFSPLSKIAFADYKTVIKSIEKAFPEIVISDIYNKYYTYLSEYKITDPLLSQNITLKIELSKRKSQYKSSLRLISSPSSNLQPLFQVEEIDEILKDKLKTIQERKLPRDLFDIWFLCQKLRLPMPDITLKIDKKLIRQELSKYLPKNYQTVTTQLMEKYGK
ncbi:nucleotidyl transferase AbiEii/AbiGii toxin family protein [Candidatus Berkelbacteria bacterium]|uniref:Nucleotidyl transferase AbiEii/AbiGii toxin family protein n=1 Tax=Candidatus Berkelbacteria bacterium CG10_big_fil_rev_8_21_14_0_10_43_14 TaxID=1974515 RepID=A0A2M6R9R6_9BACT|nr:nucleotidyl transferase AbiEii/AbiGii toxin family protein [Candidatus Berkelbacteria bacterium]OIP06064.1 MAG: hypothetical protein AUK41_03570 [Candidatus Berkelbacteria bacterium CG2_30_43_20]PIS07259.1 MAG: hypothetical protein COT79_00280 [Candidatus Berkelbacteria bacterium CG10_big_fil_rev_8_21_14_0_10_43_14]PIU87256.1 MAG: hypothetical protein COS66_01965 [Candidatus Berkelbacteria bacterium CG06_land_8_20_14_3_00_43_10]